MKHIETYIEILKRGTNQRAVASVPPDINLPGLKQQAGLSNVRKYELRGERKQLLKLIGQKEEELKKAKGNEKKDVTSAIKGAKAKLRELSLILGPMETMSDAK